MAKTEMMVIAGRLAKPLAISRRPEKPSEAWVIKSLTWMATARQASVTRDTFLLYASELTDYREDDLSVVIRRFAILEPREQYEPAFPELGRIIQAVRLERSRREQHEQRERRAAERHEELRSRVTQPEKWFDEEQIASGAVEREKARLAATGFDWRNPYSPKVYIPSISTAFSGDGVKNQAHSTENKREGDLRAYDHRAEVN